MASFFNQPTPRSEAKALGHEARDAFASLHDELSLLSEFEESYPFLSALGEPLETLADLSGQSYDYYLTDLLEQEDELFALKENVLDPIREFMSGPKQGIYDDVVRFLDRQAPNFGAVPEQPPVILRGLIERDDCYRGEVMQQAKGLMDDLSGQIEAVLEAERDAARREVDRLRRQVKHKADYQTLPEDSQDAVLLPFDAFASQLDTYGVIASVQVESRRMREETYPAQLNKIVALAQPQSADSDSKVEPEPEPTYVTQKSITVSFDKDTLESEGDVDEYLASLRKAYLAQIRNGKRITLTS